ncbi:MAG: hypothetical protein ACE5KM_02035 [Planctomycetaceae bacterium]
MTWKSLLPAAAGLLLMATTGCRSPLQEIIRGQNPGAQSAAYSSGAIIYGDGDQMIQGCPGGHCDPGPSRHHSHHYHWTYTPPQGLTYPPQNGPSGVVFYPYYTLRGPDDFFYQGK